MALADGTTIGRLRIRTDSPDPAALRLRGAAALRSLDLQPPSMPPQAILCIRAMRDPLPGTVDLRSSHSPRAEVWERAARAQIASLMRRAARPALGPVPVSAEAVLFADRSELLACAASAAAGGLLPSQWWWEHLLIERSLAGVVTEWRRTPAYVPAAVELLARAGEVATLSRVIAPADAVPLLAAVLRAHGHESSAAAVSECLVHDQPASTRMAMEAPSIRAVPQLSPWWEVAAVADQSSMAVEHRALIAVALVLRRRPSLARSESFVPEMIAWIASVRDSGVRREAKEVTIVRTRAVAEPMQPAIGHESKSAASRDLERPLTARREATADVAPRMKPRADAGPAATNAADGVREPRVPEERAVSPHARAELPSIELPIAPPRETAGVLESRRRPDEILVPPLVPDLVIQSEYAGLFFLINVFIAMELYSDFTSPVQRGIDVDLWALLRLVARALTDEGIEVDAVWPFLEALADEESPPIDAEWLADLVAKIRERLSIFERADFLIKRFARITTSPAHLDVHFSLAAHPIEIRMASLDRDPGWVPAAARHVAFHFD